MTNLVDAVERYSKLSHPCTRFEKLQRKLAQLRLEAPPAADDVAVAAPVRNVRARLGREQIQRLVARYRSGAPTTQLMEEYRLSKTAVLALLRFEGVELRRQPLTPPQVEAAKRLYQDGRSLARIERQLGLPRESVRQALLAAGVQMRPRGGQAASS